MVTGGGCRLLNFVLPLFFQEIMKVLVKKPFSYAYPKPGIVKRVYTNQMIEVPDSAVRNGLLEEGFIQMVEEKMGNQNYENKMMPKSSNKRNRKKK